MIVTRNGYLLMLFVQQRLYEGLEPDKNGDYIIKRKEFIERLPMSASTFDSNIKKLVDYYINQWDLSISFGLEGLAGENLYVDVRYEHGELMFKRNQYTLRDELSYVWGRKPSGWEKRSFNYQTVSVPENVVLPIKR